MAGGGGFREVFDRIEAQRWDAIALIAAVSGLDARANPGPRGPARLGRLPRGGDPRLAGAARCRPRRADRRRASPPSTPGSRRLARTPPRLSRADGATAAGVARRSDRAGDRRPHRCRDRDRPRRGRIGDARAEHPPNGLLAARHRRLPLPRRAEPARRPRLLAEPEPDRPALVPAPGAASARLARLCLDPPAADDPALAVVGGDRLPARRQRAREDRPRRRRDGGRAAIQDARRARGGARPRRRRDHRGQPAHVRGRPGATGPRPAGPLRD